METIMYKYTLLLEVPVESESAEPRGITPAEISRGLENANAVGINRNDEESPGFIEYGHYGENNPPVGENR